MQPRRTLLVPFLLLAPLTAQLAGTYTVNPTLPTAGNNFASLLDATNALAAQGVAGPVVVEVYDDAGPYTEIAPFTSANGVSTPTTAVLAFASWTGTSSINRVTFRPAAGEAPVLDATGRGMGVFWGGGDYVTLEGFEIRNPLQDGISLYAEASHGIAQDPIIDGCRIHDCGAGGVVLYGNTPQPANTLVQNCTFWRCQTTNFGGFNTTGRFGYITTRRTNGTRIVHNTFFVDTGVGSMFCVIGANASGATEVPYQEVSNNIVYKTAGAGRPIFHIATPTGATTPVPVVCDSNCFVDLTASPFARYGVSGATIANTLLDWQIGVLRDLQSLTADPLFVDAANLDFHLQPVSPCRNASALAAGVALDADGQVRTAPEDIGADEASDATFAVVGTGCAAPASTPPRLSNTWPFLGNPDYTLRVDNMPVNTFMFLFGSNGIGPPIPFGAGCTVHLDLPSLSGLGAAVSATGGTASLFFPLPPNPAFVGINLAFQSLVLDATAPLGFVMTNALDVVFRF